MSRMRKGYGGETVKTAGMLAVTAAAVGLLALTHAGLAQDKPAAAPTAKTATSPCKGLDQAACTAKAADCQWITPKSGKQKPYCRLKSKPVKKAAPKTSPPKQ
jgi:hypothetical protein